MVAAPATWSYRWYYHTRVSVTKRSVSLDSDVAGRIEAAAGEDGMSFSAWLSAAAERQLLLREGMRAVAEYEAEEGALSGPERAAGEALLDRLLADAAHAQAGPSTAAAS